MFNKRFDARLPYELPGFILRLILDESSIKFDPSIEEFETVLLSMFDNMLKVIQSIPRIETRLYSEWVSQSVNQATSYACNSLFFFGF
ncbi:Dynein heavy chain 7 axonemal [Fasciolopsis buskii]|uniref:Dynein heavy chain 7 axonemal n=1 Tax=Fasciolopsis buskii TaxID=27845 RepID=A0A8E0RTU5_9TREM|nr:Dynein heavy chain 7 axonemal [Fasciolopsis buski]